MPSMPVMARLSIPSPLAATETEARLARAVGPPGQANPQLAGFEFLGTVRPDGFRCRRYMRNWSRIVAPDLEGRIVLTDTGSRIDVGLRPRPEIFLMFLIPVVPWLRGQITARNAQVMLPAVLGIVVLLTAVSLWWEVAKARRFLRRVAGVAQLDGRR